MDPLCGFLPFAHLRNSNFESVVYADDNLLIGDSYENCRQNVEATAHLLRNL